jgi:outer membrane murein-binding lipoprotein Lpp
MTDTVATLISGGLVLLTGLAGMIWRLGSKIGSLSGAVLDLKGDVAELRQDMKETARLAATADAKVSAVAARIETRQIQHR